MVKSVDVYNTMGTDDVLTFNTSGPIENDFIQVVNIDGLDPVKADISQIAASTRDGLSSLDSDVASRNIVMTIRPNPDWNTWTAETLRKFIYSYFMPKTTVKLIFDSDEVGQVFIMGTVESCEANPFSKDPQYVISIICPDPYFTAVTPETAHLAIISPEDFDTLATDIHINGTVPIGINVEIAYGTLTQLLVQIENLSVSLFNIEDIPPATTGVKFQIDSIPGQKYARMVNTSNGAFTNSLKNIISGSIWPLLQPGDNKIAVIGDGATGSGFSWDLTYSEKFGGI